jgi:hypothetical protein
MFYISLTASALILLIANIWAARSPRGKLGNVCWLSGIALVFSLGFMCFVSPVLVLNFFLLTAVGLICLCTRARTRVFLGLSLLVTALSYGLVSALTISMLLEHDSLREQYPFESMTARLAYERQSSEQHARALSTATGAKGGDGTKTDLGPLARLEERIGEHPTMRTYFLMRLHEGYVQKFIESPGFGITRRIRPSQFNLEIPEPEPIPFLVAHKCDFSASSCMFISG